MELFIFLINVALWFFFVQLALCAIVSLFFTLFMPDAKRESKPVPSTLGPRTTRQSIRALFMASVAIVIGALVLVVSTIGGK